MHLLLVKINDGYPLILDSSLLVDVIVVLDRCTNLCLALNNLMNLLMGLVVVLLMGLAK